MYWVIQMGLEPKEVCQRMWTEVERNRETVPLYQNATLHSLGEQIELFMKNYVFCPVETRTFCHLISGDQF